ncbi:MAG: patatin-like phospholipase family protein [Gemmatimonadota bacterium]|nr:patatin-like phospholipase family protein [Gemmatimonadota bacterium]
MTDKKLYATKIGTVQSLFVFVLCFGFVLFSTLPAFAKQKPRVALVLSGGGARGGAHIGVLRVLEREGIPIDLIVGVSYGALVGGLYAAGYSVDDVERIIVGTDWWEITDNSPDRRLSNLHHKPMADRPMIAMRLDNFKPQLPAGIFAGQKIHHFLNQLTIGATYRARNDFDRLPTPFRAIATDILSGEHVVLKNGSLGTAIRASIAVPLVFAPISTEQTLLLDGGIANNLPVDVALDAGADLVIAVDCSTPLYTEKHEVNDVFKIADQSISFRMDQRRLANRKLADVLIMPELKKFNSQEFNRSYTLIPIGEREAEKHLSTIYKRLQALGISKRPGKSRPSVLPDNYDPKTWADIPTDIVIDRVRIAGLERYPQEKFTSQLEKFINKPTSFWELERQSGRFYATGLFQTVDYEVIYHEDYTELVFLVLENPPSEVKAGLRYDNDFRVSILAEFLHQNTYGRVAEINVRSLFGNLKFAEMDLIFRPSNNLGFLGEIRGWDQDRMYFENRQRKGTYNEKRLRAQAGLQVLFNRWGGIRAGYQVEHVRIRNAALSIGNASEYHPSYWLSARIDTRDDAFVPKAGVYFHTRGKWVHRKFSHKQVQTQLAYFANLHPQLSVGIWSHGGYVTQSAPIYEHFALGGAGYFSDAALRFVGLRRDELRVFRFASAGLSVWYHIKFWEAIPRSAVGAFYQGGLYNMSSNPIHGFGVGVYVGIPFLGPIRIDAVSTEEKDIRIYTSVGFAF